MSDSEDNDSPGQPADGPSSPDVQRSDDEEQEHGLKSQDNDADLNDHEASSSPRHVGDDSEDDNEELSQEEQVKADPSDEPEGPQSPEGDLNDDIDSDEEEIRRLEVQANLDDDDDDGGDKEEEENLSQEKDEEDEKPITASQEEDDEKPHEDGKLIADIFGDSDSEGEDFEGFKKEEDDGPSEGKDTTQIDRVDDASSSDDDGPADRSRGNDIVYDFDLMMARKREENRSRRKRKNIDIINDSDDIIAEMISQMKQAAEDDFEANKSRSPATNKLKLLPRIEIPLRKIDLREALLDSGILGVITDWLTPMPDRSLPNVRVREIMFQVLSDFNVSDTEQLKASGIGKAVMYLYKHPKETKENKARAHRLIQAWSRPIFNNETDFHSMSREEREQRDQELQSRIKRMRSSSSSDLSSPKKGTEKGPQPGDKGWIPRARVPMPSVKGYVNRPKPSPDVESTGRGSSKKAANRFELMQRSFQEKKKAKKGTRAVKISIEGRRM